MILGLKGKIKELVKKVEAVRSGGPEANSKFAGQRDISFAQYLAAHFKDGCDKNGQFDMAHLYTELGVNPDTMTIAQLIDLDQDSRWLVPEIFRDAIRKGLRTSPFFNRLVAVSENVAQPQVNMPYLNLSDAEPERTNAGETISEGTISYGNKTVNIYKRAIGIKIVDEAVQYTSISLLSIFIQDIGIKLGQKLNNDAVSILINGDQDDASEAAAVVGVGNTTTKTIYSDVLYGWIRGSRLGRQWDSIVAGELMANRILNIQEFKDRKQGVVDHAINVNETLPQQSDMFVSAQVGANQAIFLDPRFALAQLTSAPLAVESERIVSKQINGSYASITTGFANIFRDARYILDESVQNAYSGGSNDFPAFMTPTL